MSVVDVERPAPPPVRTAPPAQRGVVAIGIAIAVVLGLAVANAAGWKMTVLYGVGLALGLVLFHSRFGFTSAWRQPRCGAISTRPSAELTRAGTATPTPAML